MNILVSIIIPVYNTQVNYFKNCIESILNQSYTNYEIIIIDDCSTEKDILTYLESLLMISESIKIIHLPQNKGIAGARNYGIECARGEWICFCDHDDFWEENYLSTLVNSCDNKDTDLIVSGYKLVNEANEIIECVPLEENQDFIKSPYWIYCSSAPWNRLIRKSFLLKHNIRFPIGCLTEDITFNINCNIKARNPIGIHCYGYCNRINTGSTSRSRKFVAMSYDEMPFSFIEDICKKNDEILDEDKKAIQEAAICEQLTLLVCVFCRESDKSTKRKARQESNRLIRNHMTGYIKNTIIYNKHMVGHKVEMKIIQLGYMVAIKMHLDAYYCGLVHAVLRICM